MHFINRWSCIPRTSPAAKKLDKSKNPLTVTIEHAMICAVGVGRAIVRYRQAVLPDGFSLLVFGHA
jgi:hypothetical protein